MVRSIFASLVFVALYGFAIGASRAGEIEYPQIITTRYEAADQKNGGRFVLWSERERIDYGLDSKLYPAARFVEVVQVTPTVGSITLTYIEVRTIAADTS